MDYNSFPSLKAIGILRALAQNDDYMGIKDICEYSGLSQSTVHRILNEMVQCNLSEKNEYYKKYRVGVESAILASRLIKSTSLINIAHDELVELNKLSGETVHLISIIDEDVVYLDKINTKHVIGLMSTVGKRNPAYCTSGGKAILAYKDSNWLNTFLSKVTFVKFTNNTITNKQTLINELESIRKSGYALDNQEHHEDVICIGAPIFDKNNSAIAAISISAPSYRFSLQDATSYSDKIIISAQRISNKL